MKSPEQIAAEIVPDEATGASALRALAVEAINRDRAQDHDAEVAQHHIQRLTEWNATLQSQIAEARRLLSGVVHDVFKNQSYDAGDIYYSTAAQAFMAQGKKIQAIKQLRDDNPGLGLGEAKRFVDGVN